MALYRTHDYLNLRPFHGFGADSTGQIDGNVAPGLGIDLSASATAQLPTWAYFAGAVAFYYFFLRKPSRR